MGHIKYLFLAIQVISWRACFFAIFHEDFDSTHNIASLMVFLRYQLVRSLVPDPHKKFIIQIHKTMLRTKREKEARRNSVRN